MLEAKVATVGGRLNDCENFKKDLSGGAVVLCACFPNRTYKSSSVGIWDKLLPKVVRMSPANGLFHQNHG